MRRAGVSNYLKTISYVVYGEPIKLYKDYLLYMLCLASLFRYSSGVEAVVFVNTSFVNTSICEH